MESKLKKFQAITKTILTDKRNLFAICMGILIIIFTSRALWALQVVFSVSNTLSNLYSIIGSNTIKDVVMTEADSLIDNQELASLESNNSDNEKRPIEKAIEQMINYADQDIHAYIQQNVSKVDTIAYLAHHDKNFKYSEDYMRSLAKEYAVENVLILDNVGNVITSSVNTGRNYTKNIYNGLRQTFKTGKTTNVPFPVTHNGKILYYYAAYIDNTHEAVIEVDSDELFEMEESIQSWDKIIDSVSPDTNISTFVISSLDYTFLYPNDDLTNTDALSNGINIEDLSDNSLILFHIKDKYYFGNTTLLKDYSAYIIFAIDIKSFIAQFKQPLYPIIIAVMILAFLMTAYSIFIQYEKDRCTDSLRIIQLNGSWREMGALSLFGTIAIILLISLIYHLILHYEHTQFYSNKVDQIITTINKNSSLYESNKKSYNDYFLKQTQIAGRILSENPILKNDDNIRELSHALYLDSITIFNKDGQQIATDSNYKGLVIQNKKEDRLKDFYRLLQGAPYYIQEPMENDITKKNDQLIGVQLYDNDGNMDGVLIEAVYSERIRNAMASLKITSTLRSFDANNSYLVAINRNNNKVIYATDKTLKGEEASEIGISDNTMHNNYVGNVTIYGKKYYGKCRLNDEYAIYYLLDAKNGTEIIALLNFVSAIVLFFSFVVVLFPALYFGVIKKKKPEALVITSKKVMPAEDKLYKLINWIFLGIGIILIITILLNRRIAPITSYVINNDYEKGMNIIAISNCLFIVICTLTVKNILNSLLTAMAKSLDSRNATVCRLLKSLSSYASLLIAIYLSLAQLGIQPGTLLASAGLLSVVIGFGAQSVMADILSGLFIIFEGNCRVGDVIYDSTGFRGLVTDIGLRTSKLKDDDYNVKIINNSDLRNIINATNHLSLATCDVMLHSYVEYDKVEAAIRTEMEHFHERIPQIVRMDYRNVIEVNKDYIRIRVCAFCHEKDRPPVERALFKELRLVFEKYDLIETYDNIMVLEGSHLTVR